MVKALNTGLGALVAAIAAMALPQAAAAEYFVPPGNSAATQYTEAVPTAGGDRQGGGKRSHRSPGQVLGARNARRLDAHGSQGQAVAEVAAETSPIPAGDESGIGAADGSGQSKGAGAGKAARSKGTTRAAAAGSPQPKGSSGLSEVIGRATGASSSGGIGLLLPLAIVATISWSLGYLLRQRKRPAA